MTRKSTKLESTYDYPTLSLPKMAKSTKKNNVQVPKIKKAGNT